MNVDEDAKILWDYNCNNEPLEKADIILVLGSHDVRVGEYGGKLLLEGWAPLVMFAGGRGRLTGAWEKTEAEMFADAAERIGVPREKMLLEKESTHTGENIDFSRRLLAERGIAVQKVVLVQKPYMVRRALAAFKKRWPEAAVIGTSPPISYETYPNEEVPKDEMINILVGDTQRNKLYGAKGFQIHQEVPGEVWVAYERLVAAGYTKYVLDEN